MSAADLDSEETEAALDELGVEGERDSEPEPEEDLAPPGFGAIDSVDKATWVVAKLLAVDGAMERLDAQARAMRADLQRERLRLERRFLAELEAFAATQLKGKSRTFRTLAGDCSFRLKPGGLRVTDTGAVLEWARAHLRDAIQVETREVVSAAEIKAYVEMTRVAVPGVEEFPDVDTFTVKPAPLPRAKGGKR